MTSSIGKLYDDYEEYEWWCNKYKVKPMRMMSDNDWMEMLWKIRDLEKKTKKAILEILEEK